jgi:hypothetical protein
MKIRFNDFLNEEYSKINKDKIFDILDDYKFMDENVGYAYGQSDNRVFMLDKTTNELLAKVYYTIYKEEITISFIESIKKGKGYGKILMIYLANKYGYEKLERNSLTDDGADMRKKLDDLFGFDYKNYKESLSKHINPDELDKIKNPIVKSFLKQMIRYGYEKTWEHWSDYFIKNDSIAR